ncbi:MAG: response regulator [Clostridia bacterium]|nr:response regulator [Clostridia bacterium]
MYKILIVDDERVELQFLRHVIEKYKLPLNICGEAEDGLEAVELADRLKPDFVIIDISMPHKNGLEAAAIIKQKHPWIKIYILTAYEKFDYAKKAIEIDVEDYLTKPISPDKLISVLKKGIKSKLKEKLEMCKASRLHTNIKAVGPNIKKQLVLDLITGKVKTDKQRAAKKLLGIKTDRFNHMVVFLFFDKKNKNVITSEVTLTNIGAAIDGYLKSQIYSLYSSLTDGRLVFLLEGTVHRDTMESIQEWCLLHGYDVFAGTVTLEKGCDIYSVYKNAEETAENVLFWNRCGFFTEKDAAENSSTKPNVAEVQNKVFTALLQKNSSHAMEMIKGILAEMRIKGLGKEKAVKYVGDLLTLVVCESAKDILLQEEMEFFREQILGLNKKAANVDGLTLGIGEILEELFKRMIPDKISAPEYYVNWVIDYFKKNYHLEVTLDEVAGRLFLNPSYLSRIFKKQTGQGFNEFLNKMRIEKAKALLMTGKFSVGEVGRQVGILDSSYFSSIFKKHTDISPSKLVEDSKSK